MVGWLGVGEWHGQAGMPGRLANKQARRLEGKEAGRKGMIQAEYMRIYSSYSLGNIP